MKRLVPVPAWKVPFKVRLALMTATAVAVAIAIAALSSYELVAQELHRQVDGQLLAAAQRDQPPKAPPLGPTGGPPGNHGPGRRSGPSPVIANILQQRITSLDTTRIDGHQPPATSTQLVLPDGMTYLDQFSPFAVTPSTRDVAVAAGTGADGYFWDTHASDGTHVRVYTTAVTISTRTYAVESIVSLTQTDSALSALAAKLTLAALAGIGLALLAGALIARSAAAPVRRLTQIAEHIRRTGDLSVRLPVQGRDEVARLGGAFNGMAQSLALSRELQQRLVADAGHELRTPLTSLRANISLLLRSERVGRPLPPGRKESMLSSVDQQLQELAGLVTDLLELSRGAEGAERRVMTVPLHVSVGNAVERARLRGPGLVFDVEVEPWFVQGNPTGLDRAVVNLLDNAVKFSPAGGTVTVRLCDGELTVTDQGTGIAPEDLPHVFERFWRSDNARQLPGSGLGLAIVAQVAQECGGSVSLAPAQPHGTIARLQLPGRRADTPPSPP